MTHHIYAVYLQTALDAARAGGNILKHYWAKKIPVQQKGFTWDLVTLADQDSEKAILELIQERHPDHGILSEEAGALHESDKEFLWIVDPLDGTTNYTHQYPMVCVSVGLEHNGKPVVGVVYNPISEECFYCMAGGGAFLNGQPIAVSNVGILNQSLLATGFAYHRATTPDNNYAEFCHMTNLTQGVRRGGAAALDLAYVAAGRLDGFWEQGLKPWDIIAGALLVCEAGGIVSSYDRLPLDIYSGKVLATNQLLHDVVEQEILSVRHRFPL